MKDDITRVLVHKKESENTSERHYKSQKETLIVKKKGRMYKTSALLKVVLIFLEALER